jgi:hypothetical protein
MLLAGGCFPLFWPRRTKTKTGGNLEQPVAVATACRVLLTMPASWMPSAAVNRRDVNAAHGNHFDNQRPRLARLTRDIDTPASP